MLIKKDLEPFKGSYPATWSIKRIDERQKVNRRKTQKVEYKPDYETGKIFRRHYFDFVDIVNLKTFSDESEVLVLQTIAAVRMLDLPFISCFFV